MKRGRARFIGDHWSSFPKWNGIWRGEWPKRNEENTLPETGPMVQIKLGLPWHAHLVADLHRPIGAYHLQHVLTQWVLGLHQQSPTARSGGYPGYTDNIVRRKHKWNPEIPKYPVWVSTLDKIAKATDLVFPLSGQWMLRDFYPSMACFEIVKRLKMEIKPSKMTLDLKAGLYLVLVLLLCDADRVTSPI